MNTRHKIALLPWGNVIEDFLDTINLSWQDFCTEMTGGWLFGYIEALKTVEIETVIFCISRRVETIQSDVHLPTGAKIVTLPTTKAYQAIASSMQNPYGWTTRDTFGQFNPLQTPYKTLQRHLAPYLATPRNLLSQAIEQEHCTAILCQEYEYPRFDIANIIGKRLNIPVYATFQGGDFQMSAFEKFMRPHSLKNCAGVIIAPKTEIERFQGQYKLPEAKIARIFNPLDLSLWQKGDRATTRKQLNIPPEALVVAWHGRVEMYRKGLDILLEAWQQICREIPRETHLLLIGTGSDAAKFEQKIAQMPENIHWQNQYILDRALMCDYLAAADVYAFPSRHEGFPVAPLEAMACGLPLVAAAAPGIPDILETGEDSGGIVVPRENSAELAQAVLKLLKDPHLRAKMAQNARQRLETHYSLKAVGQQLATFLTET
ncbi:MAG: glycosyltransferase family 4 protein [Jaaginema sp. PMC 1079.18]|nr:glycosyltransferase family 4 protein [Jaaginema sp. PMC 1080.18]MEC4850267.1 glycosyltransferase family 4 protein [Jaaginema sp. PMC 1079.18]MEC4866907.1 glycosyltransferase family 4 protein [Jaaginema sp. PMC 1078.18]